MPDPVDALAASGLSVVRDKRRVVDRVDFTARGGRVLGVIGPNGAGKSSLLKAVAGILPYEGEIAIQGTSARKLDWGERARRVAYVPQQSELRSALRVRDVVGQGRYAHQLGLVRPTDSDRAETARALELADVGDLAERTFTTLSQGEKQRVLIARALATGARVLLLDEPTSALDVGHALRLYRLLRAFAAKGYCVVAVLHPLEQALEWTDDALLLDRGRRLIFGETRDVIRAGPIRAGLRRAAAPRQRARLSPPPGLSPPRCAVTSVGGWNIGALAVTMVLASGAVWMPALRRGGASAADSSPRLAGEAPLVDHSGTPLPRAHYVRIASLSSIANEILIELCEPDRVVAFNSAQTSTKGYRFRGKPTLASGELEQLLTLRPDLVFVSLFGDPRPAQRMRDAGLVVFDLGEMRGLLTLIPNVREIAAAIGHPERGERFARSLLAELGAVAGDVPPSSRKRGIYLSIYGARLFGGSRGTSYDDVLVSAGLVDAAASYGDWPQYSTEQVLGLDPDVIVTNEGMRGRICEHAGLGSLRACGSPERIVEIENALLGDPGPAMLEAAEAIRLAVYGTSAAK